VNGQPWPGRFDMAWEPEFSPDGRHLAAKVERDGKFQVVIDGHPLPRSFDMLWSPRFSPQGDKLLVRAVEEGVYKRLFLGL